MRDGVEEGRYQAIPEGDVEGSSSMRQRQSV